MKHDKTLTNLHELDLKTLESVEFMFSLHSDGSVHTHGYRRLVEMIKDLKEITENDSTRISRKII